MNIVPASLMILFLLHSSLTYQNCLMDFLRRLLEPREALYVEHKQTPPGKAPNMPNAQSYIVERKIHRRDIDATSNKENPTFDDLLESFGGDEAETDPPSEKPKSGFYFLLDWNSFLEIDDQNGRRVNLRIQPKVGDSKRFFDVTVP